MLRQREASKVHNKREKQTEQGFTFNEGGGGGGGQENRRAKTSQENTDQYSN